jgi:hypothetical protein
MYMNLLSPFPSIPATKRAHHDLRDFIPKLLLTCDVKITGMETVALQKVASVLETAAATYGGAYTNEDVKTEEKLWFKGQCADLYRQRMGKFIPRLKKSVSLSRRAQSVQRRARGWTIGVLGFDSRRGLAIILFTIVSRPALGPTHPPSQWVPGALSLGVKRPGREADHSPPSSAEVEE